MLRHRFLILLLAWVCTLLAASPAEAEIGLTFVSRAEVKLCPEYPFGGVVYDVVYTIGADPTLRAADIVSQSVDTGTNTLTVDLRFPTTMGTTPFNVLASCRNSFGFSNPSNSVSVSNCNALARLDTDLDGITNDLEDVNCDNFFSPGDISNPDNLDSDGDGVRDLVERLEGFSATNPGSSPRPYIAVSAPFDPDLDGNSEPVVWRSSIGTFFIRDFVQDGQNIALGFGLPQDIPFVYQTALLQSDVGVIRQSGTAYQWLFNGPGFRKLDNTNVTNLTFGIFGDNIILGPWEQPGITNPAVARLFNNQWSFLIFTRNGEGRTVLWGGNGDIPRVQDYDGDGIFDVAVYRPSDNKTYIIRSTDGLAEMHQFGSGTADYTPRGDFSGDGVDDITFWEPITGVYSTMLSDNGFNDALTQAKDPAHYFEMQLGLYVVHLPLNWNRRGGAQLYTVVDHAAGLRYWRTNNAANGAIQVLQWGLPGDHQG